MDRDWPYEDVSLGSRVRYTCPTGMVTWDAEVGEQFVRCAWDKDTDEMGWLPRDIQECSREY